LRDFIAYSFVRYSASIGMPCFRLSGIVHVGSPPEEGGPRALSDVLLPRENMFACCMDANPVLQHAFSAVGAGAVPRARACRSPQSARPDARGRGRPTRVETGESSPLLSRTRPPRNHG
jgi:hypothetical protein